ncbi:MAG TPA: carbamate kinase [Thermodesulfobacteriota bacterium]|nr:carbamate kinase [Thermodesulfobacteriota bacterium]
MEKVIVSIGGNALIRRGEAGTIEEQFANTRAACAFIARVSSEGRAVIITHGNGPVVGNIVIRNEAAKNTVPPMPLFICDADSEGGIGFMIQQTLYNELRKIDGEKDVVTVVTQVVVDSDDPAFKNPSKPVGPYYTEKEAAEIGETRGWEMAEDSRRGFRRVVPSPRPTRIVEARVIKNLSESGVIVIAAGGGGVPVLEKPDGTLVGVDAVVDKDLATSLLATEAGVDTLINLTEVDSVYLNFGRPGQRPLRELSVEEAKKYLARGEFAPGSMAPKIEAAVEFIEAGGKEVFITTPELIEKALRKEAGTRITD